MACAVGYKCDTSHQGIGFFVERKEHPVSELIPALPWKEVLIDVMLRHEGFYGPNNGREMTRVLDNKSTPFLCRRTFSNGRKNLWQMAFELSTGMNVQSLFEVCQSLSFQKLKLFVAFH